MSGPQVPCPEVEPSFIAGETRGVHAGPAGPGGLRRSVPTPPLPVGKPLRIPRAL